MSNKNTRFVIDTNVLLEGLTQSDGASGLLLHAWHSGLFIPVVSDTIILEYRDVLERKLSPAGFRSIKPILLQLISIAVPTTIYFSYRPSSPDPGDDHIIDCAMNGSAAIVTSNLKDFRAAEKSLGLVVLTPSEALKRLFWD